MSDENLAMWYFIIGITYMAINGFVRKLDTDGDYLLPLAWFMLWPIPISGLIIREIINKYKKLVG